MTQLFFSANFSQSAHRILLVLRIETTFMVYYNNFLVKVLAKIFFAFFSPLLVKNCHSDPKMANLAHRILVILHLEITFVVYYYNHSVNVLTKYIFGHLGPFSLKIDTLAQKTYTFGTVSHIFHITFS